MGQRIHVEHYCDLVDEAKHEGEIETVAFMFDSGGREIDLCGKHRTALIKAVEVYMTASRRAGQGHARVTPLRSRARGGAGTASGRDPAAVRAWAKENNVVVNEKGRVPEAIFQQYEAAQLS